MDPQGIGLPKLTFQAPLSMIVAVALALSVTSCSEGREGVEAPRSGAEAVRAEPEAPSIAGWRTVEDLSAEIALFRTVFWDPRDTVSLRELIKTTGLVQGKTVLEIGTGSGLISLYCLKFGASKVVATDVNPQAVSNAMYNARLLGMSDRLETRLVPLDDSGAYSVIGDSERFDLIISNPPWEDDKPKNIAEYALYDPGFQLLQSLLSRLEAHLEPGGEALLAYGFVNAIVSMKKIAAEFGLEVAQVNDDRDLSRLSGVFLPGMLFRVRPTGSGSGD